MISAHGKTKEQFKKEVLSELVRFHASQLGLNKCENCGEYKGTAKEKGHNIEVICSCDGILCAKCNKSIIRRPMSNHFSGKDCKIWHTFYLLNSCKDCRQV